MAIHVRSKGLTDLDLLVATRDVGLEALVSESLPPGSSVDAEFAWSPDGQWIAFSAEPTLYVADRGVPGVQEVATSVPISPDFAYDFRLQWNPVSNQLGYLRRSGTSGQVSLLVRDIPGGNPVLLSTMGEGFVSPNWSWSPAGDAVAHLTDDDAGILELRVVGADGRDNRKVSEEDSVRDFRWAPDGGFLAFREIGEGLVSTLRTGRANGGGTTLLSLPTEDVRDPAHYAWSPDGFRVCWGSTPAGELFSDSLQSDLAIGGERENHFGPVGEGERLFDPRWSEDSQRIDVLYQTVLPTQIQVGLRGIPIGGSGAIQNPTSNLYGGFGMIEEFFVR